MRSKTRRPEPYHDYVGIPYNYLSRTKEFWEWIGDNGDSVQYLGDIICITNEETRVVFKLKFGL